MSLINDGLQRARLSIQRKASGGSPADAASENAPLQPFYPGASSSQLDWSYVKLALLALLVVGGVSLKIWTHYRRAVPVQAAVIAIMHSDKTNVQVAVAGADQPSNSATNNNPIARAKRTFDKVHDLHAEAEANYSMIDSKPAAVAAAHKAEIAPRVGAAPEAAKASANVILASAHKLQAIFFREVNASALINGKSVVIGEEIDGAKVKAIARQSVTLDYAGQTKELSLP